MSQSRTFGELLTTYMARTGIGDAELARRIPVNRLTLVRWREGVTGRPRHRGDVLRCAELLRLTAEEQDELLLAAGFPPESAPSAAAPPASRPQAPSPTTAVPLPSPVAPPAAPAERIGSVIADDAAASVRPREADRRLRLIVLISAAAALVVLVVVAAIVNTSRDTLIYPVVRDGESVIILAPFENYTTGAQGFNVSGRLREGIDSALAEAEIPGARTAEWPTSIRAEEDAVRAVERSGAAFIIWGEYDSGRVVARFTMPDGLGAGGADQMIDIASTPSELPAAINVGLSGQVQHITLVTLAVYYLEQNDFDMAKTVLIKALGPLPSDSAEQSHVLYLLGNAYLGGTLRDYDEAIWRFTQVLSTQPWSVEALNGRALGYLGRNRDGDIVHALIDLERAVSIQPDRPATHLNLAVAFMQRGGNGATDNALDALNDALSLDDSYAAAYASRAGVYLARDESGDGERAFEDVATALEIRDDLSSAHLIHGHAYVARDGQGDVARAIRQYARAAQLEPDAPAPYYYRGLAHSARQDIQTSLLDLRYAQGLDPLNANYNRALCLQLGIFGPANEATAHCDLAVAAAPGELTSDSRGIVNARLGRFEEAIADFQAVLDWEDTFGNPVCGQGFRETRLRWIDALEASRNPLTTQVLPELRPLPAIPGRQPC